MLATILVVSLVACGVRTTARRGRFFSFQRAAFACAFTCALTPALAQAMAAEPKPVRAPVTTRLPTRAAPRATTHFTPPITTHVPPPATIRLPTRRVTPTSPSSTTPTLPPTAASVRSRPRALTPTTRIEVLTPKPAAHRLVWTYPRFRLWQYIASGVTSLTGTYLDSGISAEYPNSGWNNGILLDTKLRSGLRADTPAGRLQAARISDSMWHITQYYPVLIDGLFVPLVTDKLNFDVALQMTLLNWQAQGLTFLILRLAHRTVGRDRPPLQHCADDPEYDPICSPGYRGESASFFSGHSAMTGAAAGLVCAHHQALPLYGGTVFDSAICGATITSSLVTGVLRISTDRHWSSDVVFGWIVGGAIGYGVPYLLHYGYRSRALNLGFLPKNSSLIPYASSNAAGLTWVGTL